jgi:hypothetical protein
MIADQSVSEISSNNFSSNEAEARLDGMSDPFRESQATIEANLRKTSQLSSYKTY